MSAWIEAKSPIECDGCRDIIVKGGHYTRIGGMVMCEECAGSVGEA